jgi:hypothetical protein
MGGVPLALKTAEDNVRFSPARQHHVCPPDLGWVVRHDYTTQLYPLCTIAEGANPVLESAGGVAEERRHVSTEGGVSHSGIVRE